MLHDVACCLCGLVLTGTTQPPPIPMRHYTLQICADAQHAMHSYCFPGLLWIYFQSLGALALALAHLAVIRVHWNGSLYPVQIQDREDHLN